MFACRTNSWPNCNPRRWRRARPSMTWLRRPCEKGLRNSPDRICSRTVCQQGVNPATPKPMCPVSSRRGPKSSQPKGTECSASPSIQTSRDPAYFAQLRVDADLGMVVWPNGADLDPDVLYGRITGTPVSEEHDVHLAH